MSMVFCRSCGKEMSADAAFCPHCGASQTSASPAPNGGSQASVSSSTASTASVAVSDAWKLKFSLIEKAGGTKLPMANDLSFGERGKAIFNVLGFFFGPIYYFAKGMWKRGLTYLAMGIVLVVGIDWLMTYFGVSGSMRSLQNFVLPAIYATRANIDYYKKMVLNDNGWW
jgi:Protein of unknown function (DUF2628)/zinc-ribbon domain